MASITSKSPFLLVQLRYVDIHKLLVNLIMFTFMLHIQETVITREFPEMNGVSWS
jgi:hypothetical protein